uniref:Uncharacterized protein n=1 Tax=Opuntia streptacantha TaxID=393608 RepID=A0A7C9A341_OPUST
MRRENQGQCRFLSFTSINHWLQQKGMPEERGQTALQLPQPLQPHNMVPHQNIRRETSTNTERNTHPVILLLSRLPYRMAVAKRKTAPRATPKPNKEKMLRISQDCISSSRWALN